jgi:hypothetical protein
LKQKKQDISVRELFRKKLENAEILPDVSLGTGMMNKLRRKEFMHFDPARFNIYYLAGILAAAVTVSYLLLTAKVKTDQPEKHISPEQNEISPGTGKPDNQTSQVRNEKSGSSLQEDAPVINDRPLVNAGIDRRQEDAHDLRIPGNIAVPSAGLKDSANDRIIPSALLPDRNNLQLSSGTEMSLFDVSASSGCKPLKAAFSIRDNSFDSCRWTFGDGGYSTERNPVWIYDNEGEYTVTLSLFSRKNQKAISSSVIMVHPKPLARFEIYPPKAILPDDEIIFFNYSTNAIDCRWDFGDGSGSRVFEPRHRYDKYGIYNVTLLVTSEYGCSDLIIVRNAFSGSGYYIRFPNAFIPNNLGPAGGYYSAKSDETAQVFHPSFSGVSDYQLRIFSKTGMLIFESNDVNIGWDGYFKGELCDQGVYIWKVRGTFSNGEPFIKMGDVTLLKN